MCVTCDVCTGWRAEAALAMHNRARSPPPGRVPQTKEEAKEAKGKKRKTEAAAAAGLGTFLVGGS